ncbi:MAG TPA: CBS domain-containing protein [Candidatus Saccharimonadales bacterium]|nr:CBS domain-containing protein [Candidatus Saccharimonadales bacterium]
MSHTVFGLVLILVSLITVAINKSYRQLSPKELKRRARNGDKTAKMLYKAAAYGPTLQILLSVILIVSLSGSFVLISSVLNAWVSLIVIVILLCIVFLWLPYSKLSSVGRHLSYWLSRPLAMALHYLHPLLNRVSHILHYRFKTIGSTGIYNEEDLYELLEWQKEQPDSSISPDKLDVMQHVLTFNHKLVSDVLIPRREVHLVNVNEPIGPILLEELHKTGHSRFPVYEDKQDNIVGTLYIGDLLSKAKEDGKLKDVVKHDTKYVHEDYRLGEVLKAFSTTKQHLFVVVNSFEEFVGIVTIGDILSQLLGVSLTDDFDDYENLRAVAASRAKIEHTKHQKEASETTEVIQ